MLIVTDSLSKVPLDMIKDFSIYNISSMNMNPSIPKLDIYPVRMVIYDAAIENKNGREYQLDQVYAQMLMSDNAKFIQLMQVVRDLYFGKNVILLVYREEQVFDGLTESLCKFIQQRYGYNYQMINDITDFNACDNSTFSVAGIMNFDVDNYKGKTK